MPPRKASPERGGARLKAGGGVRSPKKHGRGGSVSRRDHNQFAEKRTHLAWALKSEGKTKPIPSYSSGEGVWGRGASLREAASPPEFPHRSLSGREREGGAFRRKAASLAVSRLLVFFHSVFGDDGVAEGRGGDGGGGEDQSCSDRTLGLIGVGLAAGVERA